MHVTEDAVGIDRLNADMIRARLHMCIDSLPQGIDVTPSEGFVNKSVAEVIDVVLGEAHTQPVVAVVG